VLALADLLGQLDLKLEAIYYICSNFQVKFSIVLYFLATIACNFFLKTLYRKKLYS
jgi:hypothetical protein